MSTEDTTLTPERRSEVAYELEELKAKIKNALNEARNLVQEAGEGERAKGYWMAHIRCALDDGHGFLGGSVVTMQDTIDEIREGD